MFYVSVYCTLKLTVIPVFRVYTVYTVFNLCRALLELNDVHETFFVFIHEQLQNQEILQNFILEIICEKL